MAGEIANNKHLINAPAGSGKTTNIRTRLKSIGCSRARKNLVIVVDETKINKFENEFKAKLISIGFEIQGFPMQETATV